MVSLGGGKYAHLFDEVEGCWASQRVVDQAGAWPTAADEGDLALFITTDTPVSDAQTAGNAEVEQFPAPAVGLL